MHGQVSLKAKWQNELKSLQQLSHNFIKIRIHKLIQIKFKEKSVIEARTSIFHQEKKSMFKDINVLPSKSFYKKIPTPHTPMPLISLRRILFNLWKIIFISMKKGKEKNHEKNLPLCESQNIFFFWGESNLGVMPSLLLSPELLLYLFIYCAAKKTRRGYVGSPSVMWQ